MSGRYVVVSGAIFGVMALAQLLRAVKELPVQVGGVEIPIGVSWLAVVVAGGMCAWAFASRK